MNFDTQVRPDAPHPFDGYAEATVYTDHFMDYLQSRFNPDMTLLGMFKVSRELSCIDNGIMDIPQDYTSKFNLPHTSIALIPMYRNHYSGRNWFYYQGIFVAENNCKVLCSYRMVEQVALN